MRMRPLRVALVALLSLHPAPLGATDEQRAILDVAINGTAKGEALVVLEDGDVWIRVHTLEQMGLAGLSGRRRHIGDDVFVALASLGPDIITEIDERALMVRLTVPARYFRRTLLDLARRQPADLVHAHASSAFLNYALDWNALSAPTVFAEAGLSVHGALLLSTLSRRSTGTVQRGQTSLTIDDRARLTRWVVGDAFQSTGVLGGGAWIGGLKVSREFNLDPYFVRAPATAFSGATSTPSTIDIYANGVLVGREQLPAGPFELRNLPLPHGRGTTRLVIRDVFGREQEFSDTSYSHAGLLARGLQEFSYGVGLARDPFSGASQPYGALTFAGRHRLGVTDSLTAGFRLEAQPGLTSGGIAFSTRVPFGELELSTSASHALSRTAIAGSLAYRYVSRLMTVGALLAYADAAYSTLSVRADPDPRQREGAVFASVPMGPLGTLTSEYRVTEHRRSGFADRATVTVYRRVTSRSSVVLGASRTRRDGRESSEIFSVLNLRLGTATTAGLRGDWKETSASTRITLQKSLPVGTGYGYRVELSRTDTPFGGGSFQYQGPLGRYDVSGERIQGKSVANLRAAGGLVAIGGQVHATRPVEDSFALVRVPGVAGVRVLASNQEIGRTNGHGDLLVPRLLPYYGNRLGIADTDIPLNYSVGPISRTIAPPYRGGALVEFPVARVQASGGRVVIMRGSALTIPAYGRLQISSGQTALESPLGGRGEFYFENLPAGTHRALILYRGLTCRVAIEVPDSRDVVQDLGTLACSAVQEEEP